MLEITRTPECGYQVLNNSTGERMRLYRVQTYGGQTIFVLAESKEGAIGQASAWLEIPYENRGEVRFLVDVVPFLIRGWGVTEF